MAFLRDFYFHTIFRIPFPQSSSERWFFSLCILSFPLTISFYFPLFFFLSSLTVLCLQLFFFFYLGQFLHCYCFQSQRFCNRYILCKDKRVHRTPTQSLADRHPIKSNYKVYTLQVFSNLSLVWHKNINRGIQSELKEFKSLRNDSLNITPRPSYHWIMQFL